MPCSNGNVCDCLGRCVPPAGQPIQVDPNEVQLTVTPDVVAVPGAAWTPQTIDVSLHSATAPTTTPTLILHAPTGVLLGGVPMLTLASWTFASDGNGVTAHSSVIVTSNSPDPGLAPWTIKVTGLGVAGLPRSILIDVTPTTTMPVSGIYQGNIVARNATGQQLTTVPVTAWAAGQLIVFFDSYHVLSPTGVFGVTLDGVSTTIPWVTGDDASQMTAGIVSIIAPTRAVNGDLSGGRFAVKLPFLTSEQLSFDFDLKWRGHLTAPTCSTDAACGTAAHCEEQLGVCVSGPEWRVAGAPANGLIDDRAQQWDTASNWFLNNTTRGLFGIPGLGGTTGIGRSLLCFPSESNVIIPSTNVNAGFIHGRDRVVGRTSGDLRHTDAGGNPFPWDQYCMQPVPLEIARDRQLKGDAVAVAGDDLLQDCLLEANLAPPFVAGDQPTNTGNWFVPSDQCVSPARLYPLLQWLTGWTGPTFHRGGLEARTLHAVVGSWLSALTFINTQSAQDVANDDATTLNASQPATSDLDRALSLSQSEMALITGKRITDALLSLPRDVLRMPDYRVPRPVSYYTFDVEDMNGTTVKDVAGEAHGTLQNSSYSRPIDFGTPYTNMLFEAPDGIYTTQSMTIPRGPAELYGDFQIAMSLDGGYQPNGQKLVLLEYGDSTNLLYQVFIKGDSSNNAAVYVKHGPRTGADPTTPIATLPYCLWCGSSTHELVISRRAAYSIDSAGNITWSSQYRAMLDNTTVGTQTSTVPLVQTLDPSSAKGTLTIQNYINEFAIWDEPFDAYVSATDFSTKLHDNYLLDSVSSELGIPVNGDHQQPIGLAATMVESTAKYLTSTASATTRGTGDAYADCSAGSSDSSRRTQLIARAGQALRYAWTNQALSARMFDRASRIGCSASAAACTGGSTCGTDDAGESVCMVAGVPVTTTVPWTDRYQKGLAELDGAREALVQALQPIITCTDPYAISPAAVPLFFGDPVGTSSQFFAASDYLLNTWAIPAVAKAQASLDQARQAWIDKRNSEIQQLQTEQAQQARIDQIVQSYAQPVIDLCGLTGVTPTDVIGMLDAGTLNPDTCYRAPSPICQTPAGADSAACYRGDLGKAALSIVSAGRGVDVARLSAEASVDRWESQDAFCATMQQRNNTDLMALQKHDAKMADLRKEKAVASTVGNVLGGITTALITGNPGGAISAIGDGVASSYDLEMQSAEANYQLYMQERVDENQTLTCYHEADELKFGIDTEYAVIKQRLVDVELAAVQFQNDKNRILELRVEADAAIAREQARKTPSVAFNYWLDPRIDTYQRDFAWARRLTFLAVRAVEYEFQQSIPADASVLRAGSVDDLQQAISELQQEEASRTINGRRPQETSIVLSLRDDVLQLSDRVGASSGERNWSAETRFGKRLQEKAFAVYDKDGKYLGQGVPFTLRDTGALAYRCAERLWRVNATIQGDIPNQSTPSVPVMLLKRNTFSSQWCDDHGDGTPMQMGTVFPSANLFDVQGGATSDGEADAYTASLLMPWFNVIRSDFYKDQYVEGSSEEFAGRGLYGDYVLLFPESGLLQWTDGDPTNDFPLTRVEDVLVRFDLISIDDLML